MGSGYALSAGNAREARAHEWWPWQWSYCVDASGELSLRGEGTTTGRVAVPMGCLRSAHALNVGVGAGVFLADGDVMLTNHVELQLRGLVPQSREIAQVLGDECALVGRDVLTSRVDLGAPQGHGEHHLSQLLRVRGHSSGERPRMAVIPVAAVGLAKQLAGHRC